MEETEKAGAPAEAHSPDGRDIGRDDASEHASEGARYVAAPNVHFDTGLRALSPWRRAQIPLIAGAVYSLVRTVGPSLRYEIIGWQHAERVYARGLRVIWPFWHQCIVPVLWWG